MSRPLQVITGLPHVREKQNFPQVREKSGNFEKMSGNFGLLTLVREFGHAMSGNFVMKFFFRLKLPSYDEGSTSIVIMYRSMSGWQILTQGLLIITVELLPFKNPGYVVGLPFITIKCVFLTLKNKINCQGKMLIRQGNVMEMSGNFEPTQMWQP